MHICTYVHKEVSIFLASASVSPMLTLRANTYIQLHIGTNVRKHTHSDMHIYICIHKHMFTSDIFTRRRASSWPLRAFPRPRHWVNLSVFFASTSVSPPSTLRRIYKFIYTYIDMCVHTHIYIYTHIHIYTYAYLYICSQ